MPNKDGIETIKELRGMHEFDDTAIIFLTALNDEKYEIEGLKIGADDYIAKPIKPELLATRIGSALRRFRKDEDQEQKQTFGELEINKTKFTVTYKAEEILLAKKEFELLSLLASKPGRSERSRSFLMKGSEVMSRQTLESPSLSTAGQTLASARVLDMSMVLAAVGRFS